MVRLYDNVSAPLRNTVDSHYRRMRQSHMHKPVSMGTIRGDDTLTHPQAGVSPLLYIHLWLEVNSSSNINYVASAMLFIEPSCWWFGFHGLRRIQLIRTPESSEQLPAYSQLRSEALRFWEGFLALDVDSWRWSHDPLPGNADANGLVALMRYDNVSK